MAKSIGEKLNEDLRGIAKHFKILMNLIYPDGAGKEAARIERENADNQGEPVTCTCRKCGDEILCFDLHDSDKPHVEGMCANCGN